MENNLRIAGYCRISLDDEMDRDNVSAENQKTIIRDFVEQKFPGSTLTFFEDRDRSGYTLAPPAAALITPGPGQKWYEKTGATRTLFHQHSNSIVRLSRQHTLLAGTPSLCKSTV